MKQIKITWNKIKIVSKHEIILIKWNEFASGQTETNRNKMKFMIMPTRSSEMIFSFMHYTILVFSNIRLV